MFQKLTRGKYVFFMDINFDAKEQPFLFVLHGNLLFKTYNIKCSLNIMIYKTETFE